MRIALVTPQWIRTKGGPSRYVLSLVENFRRKGMPVLVLSSEEGRGAVCCGDRLFSREYHSLWELFRFRPDVVHVHGRIHLIVPALIYRFFTTRRVRVFFTFHTQPYVRDYIEGVVGGRPDYVGAKRLLARFLVNRCDAITSVSQSIVDNLNSHYGMALRDVRTIPSGSDIVSVDSSLVDVFRREHHLGGAYPILSSVGVFSWDWKVAGHRVCIEAVAILRESHPNIRLLIAGDGTHRGYLESVVARLGVGDNVVFLGNIDDVETLLEATDVYVHMAMNEGCPLAVVEAMMAGKPIVAARCGGIPEIIQDGMNGILIEPEPQAVARALEGLLNVVERMPALSRNASSYAKNCLTWESISDEYCAFFQNPSSRGESSARHPGAAA